jgi:hypothetical protein
MNVPPRPFTWPSDFGTRRSLNRSLENIPYIDFLSDLNDDGDQTDGDEDDDDDDESTDEEEGEIEDVEEEDQKGRETASSDIDTVDLFLRGVPGLEGRTYSRDRVEQVVTFVQNAKQRPENLERAIAILDDRNDGGSPVGPGNRRRYLGPLTRRSLERELRRQVSLRSVSVVEKTK